MVPLVALQEACPRLLRVCGFLFLTREAHTPTAGEALFYVMTSWQLKAYAHGRTRAGGADSMSCFSNDHQIGTSGVRHLHPRFKITLLYDTFDSFPASPFPLFFSYVSSPYSLRFGPICIRSQMHQVGPTFS